MKQLSDCCKAEIKLTGSPRHEDGFACVKCGRIIGTPIYKSKQYKVKPIVILKPVNFMGKVAVRLMKFASWLFIKTGNDKI